MSDRPQDILGNDCIGWWSWDNIRLSVDGVFAIPNRIQSKTVDNNWDLYSTGVGVPQPPTSSRVRGVSFANARMNSDLDVMLVEEEMSMWVVCSYDTAASLANQDAFDVLIPWQSGGIDLDVMGAVSYSNGGLSGVSARPAIFGANLFDGNYTVGLWTADDAVHLYELRLGTSATTVLQDGKAPDIASNGVTVTAPFKRGGNAAIGPIYQQNKGFHGVFYEAVVSRSDASPTQVANMRTYFTKRYPSLSL